MRESAADRPGVVARPPLLYLMFLLVSLGLNALWPTRPVPGGLRYPAGVLLIAVSVVLAGSAIIAFRRAGTNVDPMEPATVLVTTGPYAFTRNPMYASLTLTYGGIGIALGNLWTMILLIPLLVVMVSGVIRREEVYLERKFGEPYRRYKSSVRRWF